MNTSVWQLRTPAVSETTQPNLFGEAEQPQTPLSGQFAEIVFDRPLDHAYTYAVPPELRPRLAIGKRVLTPFGKGDRHTVGFCVGLAEEGPKGHRAKALLDVLDEEALLT